MLSRTVEGTYRQERRMKGSEMIARKIHFRQLRRLRPSLRLVSPSSSMRLRDNKGEEISRAKLLHASCSEDEAGDGEPSMIAHDYITSSQCAGLYSVM